MRFQARLKRGMVLALLALGASAQERVPLAKKVRWYKGNTHTHTINTDGDRSTGVRARGGEIRVNGNFAC